MPAIDVTLSDGDVGVDVSLVTPYSDEQARSAVDGSSLESLNLQEIYSNTEPELDLTNPRYDAISGALRYHTFFGSLDGYVTSATGTGSIATVGFGARMDTGTTSGSVCKLHKTIFSLNSYRNSIFSTPASFTMGTRIRDGVTDRVDYYTHGEVCEGGAGYGFKIQNGELLGVCHDGTTENTAVLDATPPTGTLKFKGVFYPNDRVELSEKTSGTSVTLTQNLPTGGWTHAASIYLENTAGVQRQTEPGEFWMVQEP